MLQLMIKPKILKYTKCHEFIEEFELNEKDLVLTNEYIFNPFFGKQGLKCQVIFQENYGSGEPTDIMLEKIISDIKKEYKRVIAIGGGTVIDLAKLLVLKQALPIVHLYDGTVPLERIKELIVIPTTCGTGSEVTNISVLALTSIRTKKALAHDALYPDYAILIPELLEGLPFKFFATSSIDALIHAIESILSPKGTELTRLFGYKAVEKILKGYIKIANEGEEARLPILEDFLIASTMAGISFSTAGCAAVHAMSYPLGTKYHVPHGEANYTMLFGVLNNYMEVKQDEEIAILNKYISDILDCDISSVYIELEKLLNHLIVRKSLKEYGVSEDELMDFATSVINNQQRTLSNSFVKFDLDRVYKIYKELY